MTLHPLDANDTRSALADPEPPTLDPRRLALLELARATVDLSADAIVGDRSAYLDLVAPDEAPARRAEMATMSSCALAALGWLRRAGVRHELLRCPYEDTRAVTWLVQIARDFRAWEPPRHPIQPGDIVIVEGPEHAYLAEHVEPEGQGLRVDSIDGGQKVHGYQSIRNRSRLVVAGWDAVDACAWAHALRRPIAGIINVGRLLP